jgi:hypothetical protein
MDDPLLGLTLGPTVPVAPPIVAARAGLLAAFDALLTVPDGALEAPWPWRPGDPADASAMAWWRMPREGATRDR